jgi:hypothetical protein
MLLASSASVRYGEGAEAAAVLGVLVSIIENDRGCAFRQAKSVLHLHETRSDDTDSTGASFQEVIEAADPKPTIAVWLKQHGVPTTRIGLAVIVR